MRTNVSERLQKYTYEPGSTNNSYLDGGLLLYLRSGISGGYFLDLMIEGNLKEARESADFFNLKLFDHINSTIRKVLPKEAHGSREKRLDWMNDKNNVRSNYIRRKEKEQTLKILKQEVQHYD